MRATQTRLSLVAAAAFCQQNEDSSAAGRNASRANRNRLIYEDKRYGAVVRKRPLQPASYGDR